MNPSCFFEFMRSEQDEWSEHIQPVHILLVLCGAFLIAHATLIIFENLQTGHKSCRIPQSFEAGFKASPYVQ